VLLFAPLSSTTAAGAQIAVRAIGVGIAAVVAWLIWSRQASRANPPRLTIDTDQLMLVHPRLLREPLRVPRESVRLVTVDDGRDAPDPSTRFPIYADAPFDHHATRASAPRGWAWPAARGRLPLYNLGRETPNVLILLDHPLPGPRVKRETLHGPLNGELLNGLVARVRDADSAASALRAAGMARPLTVQDLAAEPAPTLDTGHAFTAFW
jgi:hypothetical protein